MVTARTVCAKTAKGEEEIERRTHGLPPRLRQMLILMDGRRDTAQAIQTVFPPELVPSLMQHLLDGGFVAELNPGPASDRGSAIATAIFTASGCAAPDRAGKCVGSLVPDSLRKGAGRPAVSLKVCRRWCARRRLIRQLRCCNIPNLDHGP